MQSVSKHEWISRPTFGEPSKSRTTFDWAQDEWDLEGSPDFSRVMDKFQLFI